MIDMKVHTQRRDEKKGPDTRISHLLTQFMYVITAYLASAYPASILSHTRPLHIIL